MNIEILNREVTGIHDRNTYKCTFHYDCTIDDASYVNWSQVRSDWYKWMSDYNNDYRYKFISGEDELEFRLPQLQSHTYLILTLRTQDELIIDRGVCRVVDFTQRIWNGFYLYFFKKDHGHDFEQFLMKMLSENIFTLTVEVDNLCLWTTFIFPS